MHKYSWLIFILPITALILSSCGGSSSSSSSSTATYTVGGTITGSNSAITLQNDNGSGGNIDFVSTNGGFIFSASSTSGNCYSSGCDYSVSMLNQPVGQVCSITNADGTISSNNVSNININCTTSPHTVSNTFTGQPDGGQPSSGLSLGDDGNFYMVTEYGGVNNLGAFLQFNTRTLRTTLLYSFRGGTDGERPQSGLTQACDRNWYGTTTSGGVNGFGTFYKITSAGVESVLYSFGATSTDAANPQGLTIDTTSCPNLTPIFYGTSTSGGDNGAGTIFSITSAGVKVVLYSFGVSPTDGAYPQAGLARGTDGNYYGTTGGGGAFGYGTFFRYNTTTLQTELLYSFGGTATDGQYPDQKPLQGADGNFYGTTTAGGANGFGMIYKIIPSSGSETVFYSFKGGITDGQQPSGRLKIGLDGNFYGVTYYGGYFNNGTFYRITPAGVQTTLYSFAGNASSEGAYPNSSLLQDANGVWWGTTVQDGVGDFAEGTIFSIRLPN